MMGRWWISQLLLLLIPFTIAEAQVTGPSDRDAPGPVKHRSRLPKGTEGFVLGLPFTIGFSDGHDFVSGDTVDIHWFPQFVPNPPHLVARGGVVKNTSDFAIDFESVPAFEGDFGLPKDLQDVVVSRQGDHGKMGGNLVDVRMLFTIAEAQFTGKESWDASGLVTHKFRIPAGSPGVVDDLGAGDIVNLALGHPFSVGTLLTMHWDDKDTGEPKCFRGRLVTLSKPQFIDVDDANGEGDTIPPAPEFQSYTVVVSVEAVVNTTIDPVTMITIAVGSSQRSALDFRDASISLLFQKITKGGGWLWRDDFGSNPLEGAGFLDTVVVSNGSTKFVDFFIIIQYDSVQ